MGDNQKGSWKWSSSQQRVTARKEAEGESGWHSLLWFSFLDVTHEASTRITTQFSFLSIWLLPSVMRIATFLSWQIWLSCHSKLSIRRPMSGHKAFVSSNIVEHACSSHKIRAGVRVALLLAHVILPLSGFHLESCTWDLESWFYSSTGTLQDMVWSP